MESNEDKTFVSPIMADNPFGFVGPIEIYTVDDDGKEVLLGEIDTGVAVNLDEGWEALPFFAAEPPRRDFDPQEWVETTPEFPTFISRKSFFDHDPDDKLPDDFFTRGRTHATRTFPGFSLAGTTRSLTIDPKEATAALDRFVAAFQPLLDSMRNATSALNLAASAIAAPRIQATTHFGTSIFGGPYRGLQADRERAIERIRLSTASNREDSENYVDAVVAQGVFGYHNVPDPSHFGVNMNTEEDKPLTVEKFNKMLEDAKVRREDDFVAPVAVVGRPPRAKKVSRAERAKRQANRRRSRAH